MPGMNSDREVWRMANILVQWYGQHAATIAMKHANTLLKSNDIKGHRAWMRVFNAISELLRTERRPGEALS